MKAIFLDKDGTLIENVPGNADPARIRLLPGAVQGLTRLRELGYALIVVTNQPGIAFGQFDEPALGAAHAHLHRLLAARHVALSGIYYCPHHPDGHVAPYAITCACRKPAPGLLLAAAARHGIDLRRSWMIGDILNDVEAGMCAGCQTILLDNGHETEWIDSPWRRPHHLAPDLAAAARIIGADAGRTRHAPGPAAPRALALRMNFFRRRE